ncbi:uncharacterized protein LOC122627586 isoform X5 [Vespula pensylvanica]|uniref:uncharacterized protein LOC122627586 isoform X5 n=1 Tax=Vespula pensylvanica TaxID=30213 RepID=UPI001CBA5480|nr:uncharacterized protein LOC122627586 isoform X5 [Vespula pensylvanica]
MPKTIMVGYSTDEKIKKNVHNVKKMDDQMKNKSTLISTNANRKKRIVRKIFQDFTGSSSLHGVKYLGMQPIVTSYIGKFLWLCTMITGIVGADMMVKKLWQHLDENPKEFFIETFHAPIFLAAFPAITICPNVPTMLTTQMDLMEYIKLPANMSVEEAMFFIRYGALITMQELNDERLNKFNAFLRENQWQLIDFLKILNPCETMIESCWWHKKKINCTDYIKQSYTNNGICCSYNYYLEHLMKYNIRFQEVPVLRTAHSGSNSGLTVIFNRDLFVEDKKTEKKNFVNSIKLLVYVHHTLSYPNAETVGYTLQKGEELMLCELEDTKCLYKYMNRKKSMNYDTCLCVNLCEDTTYQISSIKYLLKGPQLSVSPIYQHLSPSHTILNVYWKMDFFMTFRTKSTLVGWKNLGHDNTIRNDLNSQQVDLFPAITGTWPSASLSTSSNVKLFITPSFYFDVVHDYHDALVTRRVLITNQQ